MAPRTLTCLCESPIQMNHFRCRPARRAESRESIPVGLPRVQRGLTATGSEAKGCRGSEYSVYPIAVAARGRYCPEGVWYVSRTIHRRVGRPSGGCRWIHLISLPCAPVGVPRFGL